MRRIVLVGAGGHGREVVGILRAALGSSFDDRVLGYVDDDPALQGSKRDGVPVLGDWSWLSQQDPATIDVLPAIGSPTICRQLVERAERRGFGFASAMSPHALVSPLARIGRGVTVFPQVVVSTNVTLEDYCVLNVASTVSHDCHIGRFAFLGPGVHLSGAVSIGEGTFLGAAATSIPGCTIGDWTLVGAGSTVTHDLPSYVVAVGSPARVIRRVNEDGT